ncbi:MAG: hybrid sensor histidine kinase/response regulator [Burkholderiales bacterium]|nr:MAG: hybrid sensor histidine kinase/response regulator [Burkholderiales bacterium]
MSLEPDVAIGRELENQRQLRVEFLAEYRQTALRWARHASLSGAVLFTVFAAIAWTLEPVALAAQLMRGALASMCLVFYVTLSKGWLITSQNYVRLVSCAVACVLIGAVSMPALPVGNDGEFAIRTTPAIICGLFVLYAFLRLPIAISSSIGVAASCVAVLWAPLVSGGSEGVRTAVYLVFTNVVGVAISLLIESRERELFFQRKASEAGWNAARVGQRRAEDAEREKSQLIAAVSHDLRQPMMAASAHLGVMSNRLSEGKLQLAIDQASRARAAVDVLGETLDQLLVAARYESGVEQLVIESVDLNALLREVLDPLWSEADRLGVDIRVKLPLTRVVVRTDRRSLRRVLTNIVSNAVKFTQGPDSRRRSVLLAVRIRAGCCKIRVFDTGVGISGDRLDDIWRPFVQLSDCGRERDKGLGLGLFLVRRIIAGLPLHSVEVRSNVGRGSTFSVSVPISESSDDVVPISASSSAADIPSQSCFDLSDARVLVLENDQSARLALVDLLESFGASVASGWAVEQLLVEHFRDEQFVEVIVCDYQLSDGLTAPDALAAVRASLGYSPSALVITAEHVSASLRERCGVDVTIICKPFDIDDLMRHVTAAVETNRRRRVPWLNTL